MSEETKKKRPDLGIAVPVTNKKTPQSYDLSGNIVELTFNSSEDFISGSVLSDLV